MTPLYVQQCVLWCCAGLLGLAAISDLRSYLIPNRICLALAALYPAYLLAAFLDGVYIDWAGGVLAARIPRESTPPTTPMTRVSASRE